MSRKIIIIGAGNSGLITGALLSKQGYKVTIFEKETQIGGRAKTIAKNGFVIDYGLHLIRNGKYGYLPSLLKELSEEIDIIELKKPEVIYYENKKFTFLPDNMQEFLNTDILTDNDKNIIFSLYQQRGIADRTMDKSILQWLNEVNGSDKLLKFMQILSFGISCPYLERASLGELLSSMRRRVKLGNPAIGLIQGGFSTFHKKLEKIIKEYDGEINTDCEVKEIIIENSKCLGVRIKNKMVDGDIIIYTAPLQQIFDILAEELIQKEKVNFIKNIKPVSGIVIDYALSKKITDIDKLIISIEDMPLLGLVTSNIDPSVAPPNKQLISFVTLTDKQSDILDNQKSKTILLYMKNKIKEMFNKIEDYIEFNRVLFLPIINTTELNINQCRGMRPGPDYLGIDSLLLAGDYLSAEGCGGELSITSSKLCVERISQKILNK